MNSLQIPETDHGQIRVFAVNVAPKQARDVIRTEGKDAFASRLLGIEVAEPGIELFPLSDLTGVGLSGYLGQGHMVPDSQLAPARARLEALDGYVLLLFSSAFAGRGVTLDPGSDLTLIAKFSETQPDNSITPIQSAAAEPYSGPPSDPEPPMPQRNASGSLVIAGLVVLTAAVLWWALG